MKTTITKENNVCVFPILKKEPKSKRTMLRDGVSQKDVDALVLHYMKQLYHHLSNHGVSVNSKTFLHDYNMVHETLKSSLYRQCGFFHPIQDMIEMLATDNNQEEK